MARAIRVGGLETRRPGARGRFRLLPVALTTSGSVTRPMETRRRRASGQDSAVRR